jgi:hypothetical protein
MVIDSLIYRWNIIVMDVVLTLNQRKEERRNKMITFIVGAIVGGWVVKKVLTSGNNSYRGF